MTRKLKLSLVLPALLFLSACTEDIEIPYFDFVIHQPGNQDTGAAQADVFDKTWRATAYIFPYEPEPQYMAVRFETYSSNGHLRDAVTFGNFALKEGLYSVVNDTTSGISQDDNIIYGGYGQFEDDGDVLHSVYELDNRYQNKFYIDRIDTVAQIIEGRFSALFKISAEYSHMNLAGLVFFEKGEFTVNY